jgi:hypothetical protein
MSDQRIDQIFNERLHNGAMPVSPELWDRLEPFLPQPKGRDRGGMILWAGLAVVLAGLLMWGVTAMQPEAPTHTQLQGLAMPSVEVSQSVGSTAVHETTLDEPEALSGEVVADEAQVGSRKAPIVAVAGKVRRPSGSTDQVQLGLIPVLGADSDGDEMSEVEAVVPTQTSPDMALISSMQAHKPARLPFLMLGDFQAPGEARALPDPAKDCYDFGGRRSGGKGVWLAEAYTGPTFSNRKLASRLEDVSSYIARRDSTESARLSWHAGVRVGYIHTSGISVRLGAHYTVVNELFDFFDGSFSQTTTRIDTFYDASGFIVDIDTAIVTQTGKRIKTTHNHFHTIDIPLLIGYQASRDHWTYGIQAGPVFNVMHAKKGDMFSVANTIVSFTDSDPTPYPAFQDQLGLSIYASLHVGRRIGYRTMVYLEPHLQHRLRSITQDNYPIEQKQTNIGLSLGLRVALN